MPDYRINKLGVLEAFATTLQPTDNHFRECLGTEGLPQLQDAQSCFDLPIGDQVSEMEEQIVFVRNTLDL